MNEAVRRNGRKMVPCFWHMPKETWAIVADFRVVLGTTYWFDGGEDVVTREVARELRV